MAARRARGWTWLGAAAVAALLGAPSCAAGKGALMLALSTDMQTPKDVSVVSLYVETNGVPKLDLLGRVNPDGSVYMPGTLAIVEPDDPSAEVRIRVIAFQEQKARVMRDVLTTVPHQRTALLRIPLNFLDDGSVSGTLQLQDLPAGPGNPNGPPEALSGTSGTAFNPADTDPSAPEYMKDRCSYTTTGQTSIAGECADAHVDSSKLPDYSDALVFGDGGSATAPSCFDMTSCFGGAIQVLPSAVTPASDGSCSFALPGAGGVTDAGGFDAMAFGDAGGGSSGGFHDGGSCVGFGGACTTSAQCCTLQCIGGACSVSSGTDAGIAPDGGAMGIRPQGIGGGGSGVNVALVTPGTGTPVDGMYMVPLESDPGEGFSVSGNTVNLVPGVCAKLQIPGMSLMVATSACASKTEATPMCEPTKGGATDGGALACQGTYTVDCTNAMQPSCTGAGCSQECGGDGGGGGPGAFLVTVTGTQATVHIDKQVLSGSVDPACTATFTVSGPCGNQSLVINLTDGTGSMSGFVNESDGAAVCSLPYTCSGTCPVTRGGSVVADASADVAPGCAPVGGPCSASAPCCAGACVNGTCTGGATDAGMGGDAGAGCPSGQTMCGGACVDLQTDPNNCGQCGLGCGTPASPSTVQCALGRCVTTFTTSGKQNQGIALAGGSVYWTDTAAGNVMVVPSTGGTVSTSVSLQVNPYGIAGSGTQLFWTNEGNATNNFMDGTVAGFGTTIASTQAQPMGIAFYPSTSYLAWVDTGGGTVMAFASPSAGVTTLASAQSSPTGIAVDSTNVYWTAANAVVEYPYATGGALLTLATGMDANGATGIAVDATSVYWANTSGGTIETVPIGASVPPTTLASGFAPLGIAVDAQNVYWADSRAMVMSVPLGGGTPATLAMPGGTASVQSVAVDGTSVYFTTAQRVGKITPK